MAPDRGADDQGGHHDRQRDQQVQRVAADRVIDDGDVITGEVAGRRPGTNPQDSAQRVKDEKARPGIRMVPATIPFAWRSPSMNRAPATTTPPYRSKKPSALPSRPLVSPTYLPNRSTSARPPKKPTAYPMLSPATAASTATRPTATMLS